MLLFPAIRLQQTEDLLKHFLNWLTFVKHDDRTVQICVCQVFYQVPNDILIKVLEGYKTSPVCKRNKKANVWSQSVKTKQEFVFRPGHFRGSAIEICVWTCSLQCSCRQCLWSLLEPHQHCQLHVNNKPSYRVYLFLLITEWPRGAASIVDSYSAVRCHRICDK